jgi:hypothetical protein
MVAAIFRSSGAVVVIVIAVLQFTKFFDTPVGKLMILSLASLAAICVVVSEALTWHEGEKREKRRAVNSPSMRPE